jgi:hypothetical protein
MKNFFSKLFSVIDWVLQGATFRNKHVEFDVLVEILVLVSTQFQHLGGRSTEVNLISIIKKAKVDNL